jgi:serine/threonine protein kinase
LGTVTGIDTPSSFLPEVTETNNEILESSAEEVQARLYERIRLRVFDLSRYRKTSQMVDYRTSIWEYVTDGTRVAVKAVAFGGNDTIIREEFVEYIERSFLVQHPCILPLQGWCLSDGVELTKIVCDYMGETSLLSVMGENPPEWWTGVFRAKVVIGICHAMKLLHSNRIVHGNLKPGNVLINPQGRIRMSDIGLREDDMTLSSAVFTAPECELGRGTMEGDVYSFGLIVYDIVTGTGYFSKTEPRTSVLAGLRRGQRFDLGNEILPCARDLLAGCWCEDASSRWTFEQIWESLEVSRFCLVHEADQDEIKALADLLPHYRTK